MDQIPSNKGYASTSAPVSLANPAVPGVNGLLTYPTQCAGATIRQCHAHPQWTSCFVEPSTCSCSTDTDSQQLATGAPPGIALPWGDVCYPVHQQFTPQPITRCQPWLRFGRRHNRLQQWTYLATQ